MQQFPQDNIIIAGDFNFVIDRSNDSNYLQDNNLRAKTEFIKLTQIHGLVDIWRHMHPNRREFTWFKRNPLKHGRIDMIFVSDHLVNSVDKTGIISGYRTDHNGVTMSLKIAKEPRGPGIWKFNDSLLKDEVYISTVKSVIVEAVKQYANPIYSNSFVSNHLNFGEVQFTISIKLFYETLLMLIRGETVKYSKQKARKSREDEQAIMLKINRIREAFALSGEDNDADRLLLAQKDLEKIREPKIQGLITRSRVRWHDEGEKCSKYFLSLERINAERKSIHMIKFNNQIISEKREIISTFSKQLGDRYNACQNADKATMHDFVDRNIKNKLTGCPKSFFNTFLRRLKTRKSYLSSFIYTSVYPPFDFTHI